MFCEKSFIFYFSGTGNSAFIAKLMAESIDLCEAVRMEEYMQERAVEARILGFVFPVYWWGIPNIVRSFLERLQIGRASYVFAAATMGMSAGNAVPYVKELLAEKKTELRAGFVYRMPDNYIIAHGAPGEKKIRELVGNAYLKVMEDIEKIKKEQSVPVKRAKRLIHIVNKRYIDTYKTADLKFGVSDACVHCGLCAKECPVKNIVLQDGMPMWRHQCESCMRCIQICPKKAIDYAGKTSGRKRYVLRYEEGIRMAVEQNGKEL